MIAPQVPAGGLIGQAVLHDESHGQRNDAMRVMGLGQGVVGHVRVEILEALGTAMLGVNEVDVARPTGNQIADIVEDSLAEEYGRENVSRKRRSVCVNFDVAVQDDESGERVVSFDVVPAFRSGDDYEIPDTSVPSGWTKTNPRIHEEKATAAHKAYANEWKGLIRMMKYWNNNNDKTIKPSFLIEVMALDVLHPPYGGDRAREMQAFFATLAGRVHETWKDPAGLGPAVSDMMDAGCQATAEKSLRSAERQASNALALTRMGKQGDALQAWRTLFGPLFPLS